MTSVRLQLPPEITEDLGIPYEGIRDLQGIAIAVDGINTAASVVTLAALTPKVRELAVAIRRWRLRDRRPSIKMTIKGPAIDITIDLPPNVSTGELIDQLRPLLDDRQQGQVGPGN